ncbi:hypothetical protein QMA77_22155 [Pantoea ananatis]|uniref:hypothetical protein n=1 Tax=Pantoea ananas TaxID=553 RepID=UPI0024ADC1F6|nr:hypothetical protein [Pantoea ananatis]MDI6539623.1 hypothetical protein [Pantoea ananatis]
MKGRICKNLSTLLILSAFGTSFATHAASQADVTVTATIVQTLELTVSKDTVTLDNNTGWEDTVDITTSNNVPANLEIISNTDVDGNKFNLIQNTSSVPGQVNNVSFPVEITPSLSTPHVFDKATKKMTLPLSGIVNQRATTLKFNAKHADAYTPGSYTGTLTLKIAAM